MHSMLANVELETQAERLVSDINGVLQTYTCGCLAGMLELPRVIASGMHPSPA